MQINRLNGGAHEHKSRRQQNINNTGRRSYNALSADVQNPSFKGGIDSLCLGLVNWIERGGLAVSFTLQDMLGTNLPRPIMGLFRNKNENKGQQNKSFAAKEFVREFLTGPSMFIIPWAMLGVSKMMFGKACEIPARFIKAFSNIHAQNPAGSTKEAAKQNFYTDTFAQIIKNAKGEEKVSKETAEKAAEYAAQLIKGEKSGNKKTLGSAVNTLFENFTAITKQYASDSIYTDFTSAKTAEGVSASFKKTVSYMMSYADDLAVKASKQAPDKVKEFITKTADKKVIGRFALNTIMYSAVMSFLWLIPKLYNAAEGSKNAGLKGLMQEETFGGKDLHDGKHAENKNGVTFGSSSAAAQDAAGNQKGAKAEKTPGTRGGIKTGCLSNGKFNPSFGSAASIASKITGSGWMSKFADIMEFDGLNVSFPLLLGIMGGGILIPRILRAKDKYDKEEIKRRDYVTCGVMCFGAKWLEKLFSKINEAKSGFVLTSKDAGFKQKGLFGKIFDYFKPVNGVRMMSSDYIRAKYSNIEDYKNGIQGFCDFISEQGGSLAKVFGLTDKSKEITSRILGRDISGLDNKTITEALSNPKNKEEVKKLVDLFKDKDNEWVKKARTLNARFTALSILVLVPVFLGFMLPWINERATKKRIREEQAALEAQKTSSASIGAGRPSGGGRTSKTAAVSGIKTNSSAGKFDFMKDAKNIKSSSVFAEMEKYTK